ncbi:hypothetical protein [Sulfobacillus harzensis]|uniref:Uncharacterized protein n=1 Tax=Sulfobacillus harzensis TaxID=2729629 RepID=A0A7Y0L5A9_9FIRM|nr:hypothetical protein [Sulfobacillus harzensis]NMP22725.1 hypothetical protein [Sulfobacillus harzensis]
MKRILIGLLSVAALLAASAPSYADAVTSSGPGKPVYAVSNTGSSAGQANRSTTGTAMKTTNDRVEFIWDF